MTDPLRGLNGALARPLPSAPGPQSPQAEPPSATPRTPVAGPPSPPLPQAQALLGAEGQNALLEGLELPAPVVLDAGDEGPEVRRLQGVLAGLGHYEGPAHGQMDRPTVHALQAYQARFGLSPDGVAGPRTWAQVEDHEAMLSEGARLLANEAGPSGGAPRPAGGAESSPPPRPLWVAPPVWESSYLIPGVPPSSHPDTPGARAYAQLQGYNEAPNPLSPADTLALGRLALQHQQSLLTVTRRLPVDGGSRELILRLEPGVDADQAAAVVAAMYEASHPEHRQSITEVRFQTGNNAMDEHHEHNLRGVEGMPEDVVSEMTAGAGVITFYNVGNPDHPLRQDLWDHELAHVVMERHDMAETPMVPEGWVEAIEADRPLGHEDELGGYATANLKEDFAESYRHYVAAMREGRLEAFLSAHPHRSAILNRLFELG